MFGIYYLNKMNQLYRFKLLMNHFIVYVYKNLMVVLLLVVHRMV